MDSFIDFFFEKIMFPICVVCIIGVFIAAGVGIYDCAVAETFSLRKDAWECTQSHQETSTVIYPVGKVMVPSTSTSTVCDQWSRK